MSFTHTLSRRQVSANEIAGRGLGGLLVQAISAPVAVVVNAVAFGVSALSLRRLKVDQLSDSAELAAPTGSARGDGYGRKARTAGAHSSEHPVHRVPRPRWDFASATGQKVTVSDEVATYVLGLAEQIITLELRESAGFDSAISISEDARALDRLLAFSGRAA